MASMNKLFSLELNNNCGILREREPIKIGIPFPIGCVFSVDDIVARFHDGTLCQVQLRQLSQWKDSSIKWVVCDFFSDILPYNNTKVIFFKQSNSNIESHNITITHCENYLHVNTSICIFHIDKKKFNIFYRVVVDGSDIIDKDKTCFNLKDSTGRRYNALINDIIIEDIGSVRATVKISGNLVVEGSRKKSGLTFISRATFWNYKTNCKIEFAIRNSKAAYHHDGYWDLGDKASFNIGLLSFSVGLRCNDQLYSEWRIDQISQCREQRSNFYIYQDSSGGDNWRSKNHMDHNGSTNRLFRGFKVIQEDGEELCRGNRATPELAITDNNLFAAATVENFWQNCPSSLGRKDNVINIAFYPNVTGEIFELQGGEQKTFKVYLCFSNNDKTMSSNLAYNPIVPIVQSKWYQRSGVINYFTPKNSNDDIFISELIESSVNGKYNFFHRREIIDEYGWRNFGDFFADHESYECSGDFSREPIISHYNNQYDILQGLLVYFARTGQENAFILARDLAGHVVDIDIYHTTEDCETDNNGLFWHTNHFLEANTATHRAFSSMQNVPHALRPQNIVGGGHSYEHAYTKGLLYFYYMTGDESIREAVMELVSWVKNGLTVGNGILSKIEEAIRYCKKYLFSSRSNELSSPFSFDGPGRASGNALSVLLDGYELTKDYIFIKLAEYLIYRCVNPLENISSRDMLNPNTRQMYTIFLYSLSLYLEKKKEIDEIDCNFSYARDVILHYARWICDNEYLFLSKPEILDFPNHATRTTQDLRKANILIIASQYTYCIEEREKLIKRGLFFYNSATSLLMNLDTRILTRPMAILLSTYYIKYFFDSCSFVVINNTELSRYFNNNSYKIISMFNEIIYSARYFSLKREVIWFLSRMAKIKRLMLK